MTESRAVSEIIVNGDHPERGNVMHLAGSIERLGLLHPVVINTRNEIIAGRRRLAAVRRLGWDRVPVRVVASLDDARLALLAERDENTCREPLPVGELLRIGAQLEELEKPKAKQRREATQPKKGQKVGELGGGNLPPPSGEGKTRDKVAAALGVSGRTYEKAKQVAEAAQREPERFGDLPAVMDEQSVDAAHRELRRRRDSHTRELNRGATDCGPEGEHQRPAREPEVAGAGGGEARRQDRRFEGLDQQAVQGVEDAQRDVAALTEARRLIEEWADDNVKRIRAAPALRCLDEIIANPD